MSLNRATKDVAERAIKAQKRVTDELKKIDSVLTDRQKRATTNPFNLVEIHEEDSLVDAIENVIKTTQSK